MQLTLFQSTFAPPFAGAHPTRKNYRRRTFTGHRRKAGIYLIRENGTVVYVGMSQSCIVKALYRHFYPWSNDKARRTKFPRVTYANNLSGATFDCCILETGKDDAPKIERGLILSLQPRDNRERYRKYLDELIAENTTTTQAAPVAEYEEDLPF